MVARRALLAQRAPFGEPLDARRRASGAGWRRGRLRAPAAVHRLMIGLIAAVAVAVTVGSAPALAAPGYFDTSFGVGGKSIAGFGGYDVAQSLARQPDGKLIVAGYTSNGENGEDFAVARLLPNGYFDTSFGVGGKSYAGFGGSDVANAVAIQPDGKIIVAGYTTNGEHGADFAVARLLPDGYFDPSFGVGGKSYAGFGGTDVANAVAIQPDGKIIVAGYTTNGEHGNDFAIARLLPNGYFDPSFGVGGKSYAGFGASDTATGVALQPDGKIIVAGSTSNGEHGPDMVVARLSANGYFDPSFGVAGKSYAGFGGADYARAVALQTDGKIVLAGTTSNGEHGGTDFAIARLLPTGYFDPSFGIAGKSYAGFGGNDQGNAVAIQPDGKIVVAGSTATGSGDLLKSDMAVARLLPTGYFDPSFGVGGKSYAGFGANSEANGVVLQPDGKLVIAGDVVPGVNGADMAIARLLGP